MKLLGKCGFFVLVLFFFITSTFGANAQSTVNLTGVVPPKPSDLQNELESLTGGDTFAQDRDINYQITYGSNVPSPQNITIRASWTLGSFPNGTNSPSAEILSYIIGSATNGYNDTAPVVDLANRTITWTISNFPSNTQDQTVEFSLRTTNNYTGNARAAFTIQSDFTAGSTSITDSITSQSFLYNFDPDSYTKSLTPPPTGTPTPTPTPPPNVEFRYIITPEIRQDRAKVEVKTLIHTTAVIKYGTSPQKMNQTLSSLTPRVYHFFTLSELEPDTEYYFQIEIKDAYRNRSSATSDIFTFSTANISSDVPEINTDSVIFTSNSTILFDGIDGEKNENVPIIILPTSTPFEFKFSLKDQKSVKGILSLIRENNLSQNEPVLGISLSPNFSPQSNFAQIIEVEKGVYIGRLLSSQTPGLIDVVIRISDFEGNIIEYKLGTVKTVVPMRIVNKNSKKGLENARVELSLYNPTQRMYQIISPQIIPISNPAYSDSEGIVNVLLPQGKYKAQVSLIRYEGKSVEFTIGPYENEEYPIVELEPKPFTILETAKYYIGTLFDFGAFTKLYTNELTSSTRMYDLLNLLALTILCAIILTILLKTIWDILNHLIYPLYKRTRKLDNTFIQARVFDIASHDPISHVHVYLVDLLKDKIIAKARTNKFGYTTFHIAQPKSFRLTLLKEGYEAQGYYEFKRSEITSTLSLWMKQYKNTSSNTILRITKFVLKSCSVFVFELAILIIILLELLFITSFGMRSMMPILTITGITLLLMGIERIFSRKRG